MIKSIVVALDGSEESVAGLEQANQWAARLDAHLRALYVLDERRFMTFPTYSDSEGSVPKPIPLTGDELKAAEEAAAKDEADVKAAFERATQGNARGRLEVVRGRVEETLIREAKAADMVVIGKRGRGHDLSDEAAGPTTETLIHEALRPVLVVPAQANTSGPILIAFDGSKGVQRAVVPGVQLAAALGAPVTVLTLAESQDAGDEIQAPLKQYLASYGVKGDFRVQVGRDTGRNAAKIVMDTASELNAGMILMGAFSVSPLKEFFVGSVTREVLTHAHCPVLMMT